MESLIHRNEKKELEEKENGEEIESLRITNKYVKKVIYLFIYNNKFLFREEK